MKLRILTNEVSFDAYNQQEENKSNKWHDVSPTTAPIFQVFTLTVSPLFLLNQLKFLKSWYAILVNCLPPRNTEISPQTLHFCHRCIIIIILTYILVPLRAHINLYLRAQTMEITLELAPTSAVSLESCLRCVRLNVSIFTVY